MTWYQFVLPAVVIALAVRLEATFVGPYWSWLEMLTEMGDDTGKDNQLRRVAFLRRVAIPGVVAFVITAIWPVTYGVIDVVIVALAGAGLLLWPLIFHGLPWGVSGRRLVILYAALVTAFAASGWLGGHIAAFAHNRGGVGQFLEENVIGIIVGGVLVTFATGIATKASTSASRSRR